jgi:hypothetical protein
MVVLETISTMPDVRFQDPSISNQQVVSSGTVGLVAPATVTANLQTFTGSEYGSCASLDSVDRSLASVPDNDTGGGTSTTVDSECEARRRRRAAIVRARTANARLGAPTTVANIDSATAADKTLSAENKTIALNAGIKQSDISICSEHEKMQRGSAVDGSAGQTIGSSYSEKKAEESLIRPSSSRGNDHTSSASFPSENATSTSSPLLQSVASSCHTHCPTSLSPSSSISSTMSASLISTEAHLPGDVAASRRWPTRSGERLSTATSADAAIDDGDASIHPSSTVSQIRPRMTIYANMRERAFGTRGTATGQQKLAAKDQFNVLLGQALETTSNRSSQEHQRNLGNKPLHNSAETMCPTIPENLAIHGDPDTKTSDSGRPSTRHMTSQVAGVISPDLPTIRSMSVDQLEKYRLRPDQQATEEAKKAVTRRQRLDETTSDDDRHPQFVLTGELAITGKN